MCSMLAGWVQGKALNGIFVWEVYSFRKSKSSTLVRWLRSNIRLSRLSTYIRTRCSGVSNFRIQFKKKLACCDFWKTISPSSGHLSISINSVYLEKTPIFVYFTHCRSRMQLPTIETRRSPVMLIWNRAGKGLVFETMHNKGKKLLNSRLWSVGMKKRWLIRDGWVVELKESILCLFQQTTKSKRVNLLTRKPKTYLSEGGGWRQITSFILMTIVGSFKFSQVIGNFPTNQNFVSGRWWHRSELNPWIHCQNGIKTENVEVKFYLAHMRAAVPHFISRF